MPNVHFSEILFADDTLIFAAPGTSTKAFVWAIEAVFGAYGLNYNKTKCARLALRDVAEIMYSGGGLAPRED